VAPWLERAHDETTHRGHGRGSLARDGARGGDWNDKAVGWQAYDAGLARAKQDKKPVMLVVFTEWCPHCTNYSKLFHDPQVVEKVARVSSCPPSTRTSKPEISKQPQRPTASTSPRTYFLSSGGVLGSVARGQPRPVPLLLQRERPKDVLAAMDSALAKLAAKPK
jgi:hypothetical protein